MKQVLNTQTVQDIFAADPDIQVMSDEQLQEAVQEIDDPMAWSVQRSFRVR
jgi:hypothetical protein